MLPAQLKSPWATSEPPYSDLGVNLPHVISWLVGYLSVQATETNYHTLGDLNIYYSQVWGQGSSRSRHQQTQYLVRACLLVCKGLPTPCILPWPRQNLSLWGLL